MSNSTRDNSQTSRSLTSRLRFSHKLTILSIIFVVPTVVAIYFLLQFLQEQVQFSAKERQGAEVILPLGTLMLSVQSHGGTISAIINGSKIRVEEIAEVKRRSDADIAVIDPWMSSTGRAWVDAHGKAGVLNDKWGKFKDAWSELQQRGSKDEAKRNFDDHAALANQLVDLISLASDISNITLDPEMEEYALGDTIVNQIPAVASNFSQARTTALAGLSAASFSTEDRTRLLNSQALGADAFSRATADIAKSGDAQPAVKLAVDAPLTNSQSANTAYSQAIDQTLGFSGAAAPEVRQTRGADFHSAAENAVAALSKLHQASTRELDRLLALRVARFEKQRLTAVSICLSALVIALVLAILITRALTRDIGKVAGTVDRVSKGDYGARVKLGTQDEIGNLAQAFDNLLDERVATLEKGSKENEQLNTSVIEIMRSVAQLAQRDLTVKVPVSADVTGAISDAINLMTNETTKALKRVASISGSVADATGRVKLRSDEVLQGAENSGAEVNAASLELANAARALREIAGQAQQASKSAESAISASIDAMTTVRATVDGISLSRDQIRETEKRVKRLGERSQEISSVIGIIGQIAERTSVLALNASMQAVAAGDAGRGFAVVADEVKRLAENARQATQQIASLVSAIQADTVETTQAMNNTITQVVDMSKLAERAGGQMQQARSTTEDLVNSVRGIVNTTEVQAKNSDILLNRARQLVDANQKTLVQLGEQRKETENLQGFSKGLLDTVQVFRLPV